MHHWARECQIKKSAHSNSSSRRNSSILREAPAAFTQEQEVDGTSACHNIVDFGSLLVRKEKGEPNQVEKNDRLTIGDEEESNTTSLALSKISFHFRR